MQVAYIVSVLIQRVYCIQAKARKLRRSVSSGVEDEPFLGMPPSGHPPHSALEVGSNSGSRSHFDHRNRAPSTGASASAYPSESMLNQRMPFL